MSYPKLTIYSPDMSGRIELDYNGTFAAVQKVTAEKKESLMTLDLDATDLAALGAFATAMARKLEGT